MTCRAHRRVMLRASPAFGLLLLLGALLAVSGSAAGLTPVGEMVCNTIYDVTWHAEQGPGRTLAGTWVYATSTLDSNGRRVADTAWDNLNGTLPDQDAEQPQSQGFGERNRICIHFLSICGPVLAIADRL